VPAHNFDQYAIYLFSSKSTGEASSGYVAGIYFYQGGKYRGRAFFYPDGQTLPDPIHDSNLERIFININLSQFHAIAEILRTEKPLFIYYYGAANAGIRSGREPVGEEEGIT